MNRARITHSNDNPGEFKTISASLCYGLYIYGVLLVILCIWSPAFAATLDCLGLIKSTDSLLLADPQGRPILYKNASIPRIPASTLKVLTSLAAIHELGTDYRFKTEFYQDEQGNLIIKGYGDPLLISEVLKTIALSLSTKTSTINKIIVDNSYFSPAIVIPGRGSSTNPYDAPPAALSVNFNTIKVAREEGGRIISGEPQTPITPLAERIAKAIKARNGRYTIGDDPGLAALYAGELMRAFLIRAGLSVSGGVCLGSLSGRTSLLLAHRSPFPLTQVIHKMLKFSSNFMANQLLMTMGAQNFGPPATLDKGLKALRRYATDTLGLRQVAIVEGSGISRQNRISAREMLKVLMKFRPFHVLMRNDGQIFYKTGTLKGIRTCVGYIKNRHGLLYPFVIFLNRPSQGLDSLIRCIKQAVSHCHRAPGGTESTN